MPTGIINKGNEVYYELHGKGPPLILITGYSCDHAFWGLILDKLAKDFQVLIFDNRAVGQTKDSGNAFSVEDLADDTITLATALNLVHPHILGHSMGGAIAQSVAKKYPDKINKLIILNSAAKFSLRTLKATESLLNLRKENVSLDLLIDASMPWFFSGKFLSNTANINIFKELVKNNPHLQSVEDQERQYKALSSFDSRTWLNQLKCKTLVGCSSEDIITSTTDAQQLVASIANAELKIIPGGHSSPLEQPNAIIDLIKQFLI